MSTIDICGVTYTKEDTKEKMYVTDCFVDTKNKIGTASGEKKFYIRKLGKPSIRDFFGNLGFEIECFVLKKDLIQYLNDAKAEYLSPEQNYQRKNQLPLLFEERLTKVNRLPNIITFEVKEKEDLENKQRTYIKSDDEIFKSTIPEIALPRISYLSVIKLKREDDSSVYYFKLFFDTLQKTEDVEIEKEVNLINESNLPARTKKQLVNARIGQGKYRNDVLNQCPKCPITLVEDCKFLRASHIKPWKDSDNREKIDPKNGFMFTPTIDLLFNDGYISFTDDKKMLVSSWLSEDICKKLDIVPNVKYKELPTVGREFYLEYHREKIFKN